jgi:hypothetical protein
MGIGIFGFAISFELRQECVTFFYQFDEFHSPDNLRTFTHVTELKPINEFIPSSKELDPDKIIIKMLTTPGRSSSEPILFDLLDLLAQRYKDRDEQCKLLKEKIRNELLQAGNQEQAKDYKRRVEVSTSSVGQGEEELAAQWIKQAGDNLDELALRITLAVFNGTTFEVIERAKNDLHESLQELVPPPPPPKPDEPPPVVVHIPLMRRLQKAGAKETAGTAPNWKRVLELEKEKSEFASEAIRYVWEQYRETEWRQKLIEWLTSYVVGQPADVRTCAAVAAGILAIKDYRFVTDRLLSHWIASSDEDDKKAAEYRMAIGMALGVLAREENWAGEVQNLVWKWSKSAKRAERWTAVRAYIYVGAYCRPVSEVIERWRAIAASELITVYIEVLENKYVQLNNPMHMSLMDAMLRFFVNVAQMPTKEKRPLFAGILEGLKKWVSDNESDAGLGLFMFTTLGRLMASPAESEGTDSPPLLLHLIEAEPAQTAYRTQLAGLFELMMSSGAMIIEARELLCAWLGWADNLQTNGELYESRIQTLLTDIIAADQSGRMRRKLTACLRDCGRKRITERVLARL